MVEYSCLGCPRVFLNQVTRNEHEEIVHGLKHKESNPYSDYAINLFMSELSNSSPECKARLKRMLKDLLEPA